MHSSGSSVIAADCIKADSSPLSLPLKGSTYQNTTSKGHIHIRTPLYCMAIGPASSVTVHSNVLQYSSTLEFAVTLQTLQQCTVPFLICTAAPEGFFRKWEKQCCSRGGFSTGEKWEKQWEKQCCSRGGFSTGEK